MSHKAAKKVRRLLKVTGQAKTPDVHAWQEREYMEDTAKRKKQLVELKSGEEKEIEVSMGTVTLKQGSGRAVYKLVKKAMAGHRILGGRAAAPKPWAKRPEAQPIDIREVPSE